MRRSIVTSMGSRRITAEEENGRITGLFLENSEEQALVGRIFAGRVSRIQKNIRAAFVDGGGFHRPAERSCRRVLRCIGRCFRGIDNRYNNIYAVEKEDQEECK